MELNRGWGLGYGVVEAVVELADVLADGEVVATFGLATIMTVRVLVEV